MAEFRTKTYAGGGGPGKVIEATATTKPTIIHGQMELDGTEPFSAGDRFDLCFLPKGMVIASVAVSWDDWGAGTALDVDLGFYTASGGGLDADVLLNNQSLLTAADSFLTNFSTFSNKLPVDVLVGLSIAVNTAFTPIVGATLDVVFVGSVVTATSGS